jgi:dihydrodipicolinate synthase/N-acetylneuraminate lyase
MKEEKEYKGVVVPAITPLVQKPSLGREPRPWLDVDAVGRMFENFHRHNVSPFILGTTGEAASLTQDIKQAYVETAGRLKKPGQVLYVGISSNVLKESQDIAFNYYNAGADVFVATLPSYYPLTPAQMKRYFKELAEYLPAPLMIYNIPATVHMSIPLEVVDALSRDYKIVGFKDSERNEERLQTALKLWANRDDFSYFAGWAAQAAQCLLKGGDGIIPSTGNIAPGLYNELYQAAISGNEAKAMELQNRSNVLGNIYQEGRTLGDSLWALKVIMKKEGLLSDTFMMPPLHHSSNEEEQKVLKAWETTK